MINHDIVVIGGGPAGMAAAVAAQAEPMPAASMMVKNVFFIILNRVDRQLVEGNIQNLPFHAKPIPDL